MVELLLDGGATVAMRMRTSLNGRTPLLIACRTQAEIDCVLPRAAVQENTAYATKRLTEERKPIDAALLKSY